MRFLVDAMCGTLARYLRMCGYDAAFTLDLGVESDAAILAAANEAGRRLVTRDADLAAAAPDAILLEATDITRQLAELRAAGVELTLTTPERCGRCNGPLRRVSPTERTPEYAADPADRPVWRCADCGQHFWRGSHWDDVADRLADAEPDRPP